MPPSSTEDIDRLLEQARNDRQAFDALFARYRDYLQQVVSFRLDPAIRARVGVSDIVQDAQWEAAQRMPEFLEKRPMPFRLWLRRIACDHLLMARRRHVDAACRSVQREMALPDESTKLHSNLATK